MTNAEMDAVQVHDTPMRLQRTLTPRLKLLRERLIEATDGTRTGRDSHQRLGHFSHLMGTCPGDKHLGESFRNVRFIATVAFKGLGVEFPFTISRDVDLLEPTSGSHQVARVVAVAVPFALGVALSPARSNELIELFTHHGLYHD